MNRIRKYKKFAFGCICFFIVALMVVVALFSNYPTTAFASRQQAGNIEQVSRIYSNATLEDDFCDKSLIVVMDEKHSQINTQSDFQKSTHAFDLFDRVGINAIRDLTALPERTATINGREKFDIAAIEQRLSESTFRQILRIDLAQSGKQNILNAIKLIENTDGVRYVGPNYIVKGASISPNDSRFGEQWGLTAVNGINAKDAWGITAGAATVRVGVLDTGINAHNDLNANLVQGWDFKTIDPSTGTYSRRLRNDIGGHGTKVAGIIGAVGNNTIGITGVSQTVSLIPLQTASTTTESGYHDFTDIAAAITHARNLWNTNERIDIINCSISGFAESTVVLEAAALYQGLFVWSAGNGGDHVNDKANIDRFNETNVVSVGAYNGTGERSVWSDTSSSNYGNAVNIWAPGGSGGAQTTANMLTTHSIGVNNYIFFNGTSAAAPFVSGTAALMLSVNPNLTGAELKTAILENADTITDFSTPAGTQTVKRLNAFKAVSSVAFQLNNAGNTITGLNFTPAGELTVPDIIDGKKITAIGESAFAGQTELTSITIPYTITSIGQLAFQGCSGLNSVTITESVTSIGLGAFAWSNVYPVTFNKQGGTGGSYYTIVGLFKSMPAASAPTKIGYSFGGYYSSVGGGLQYYDANMNSVRTYNSATSITLYAKWTVIQYTVTLNDNEGSGGDGFITVTYGQPMPEGLTAPTKEGYVFAGYYYYDIRYYNPDMTSARPMGHAANITLHAQWVVMPDYNGREVFEFDDYFEIDNTVYSDVCFIIIPSTGGAYWTEATIDIYYYGINVRIYDIEEMALVCDFVNVYDYGYTCGTVSLESDKSYLLEIYSNHGLGMFYFQMCLQ